MDLFTANVKARMTLNSQNHLSKISCPRTIQVQKIKKIWQFQKMYNQIDKKMCVNQNKLIKNFTL